MGYGKQDGFHFFVPPFVRELDIQSLSLGAGRVKELEQSV